MSITSFNRAGPILTWPREFLSFHQICKNALRYYYDACSKKTVITCDNGLTY